MRPTHAQLDAFRARHGLTRARLAELCGLDPESISKYLGGAKRRQLSEASWVLAVMRLRWPVQAAIAEQMAEDELCG